MRALLSSLGLAAFGIWWLCAMFHSTDRFGHLYYRRRKGHVAMRALRSFLTFHRRDREYRHRTALGRPRMLIEIAWLYVTLPLRWLEDVNDVRRFARYRRPDGAKGNVVL